MDEACLPRHRHPAVRAWRQLGLPRRLPAAISVLQKGRGGVYALHAAGPGNCTVVAKRSALRKALVEKTIYEQVLPGVPARSVAYFGFVPEEETGWIFIEQVQGTAYASGVPAHREAAARWLARLHLAGAPLELSGHLPARSPEQYLGQLTAARERLEAGLSNPVLAPGDPEVLRDLLRQLADLRSGWDRLAALCAGAPCTVVHGDFARKNLVVHGGREADLRVFDWGTAGWGIPAADLAQNEPGESYWVSPDLETYRRLVRERWPQLDRASLGRLAAVGKIVRTLAAIHGDAMTLATPWAEQAMRKLPVYSLHLAAGMAAAGIPPAGRSGSGRQEGAP